VTSPPTILFIEDNEDDIFFLLRAVKRLPSAVNALTARDGAEAVEVLEKIHNAGDPLPNAIVTDLKMPIRTGYEFLAWRQDNAWAAAIPAYVLSSSDLERDKERATALKATAYFVKPERAEHLTQTIGEIVKRCCQSSGTA
jgi:CheY-like chemotaxis protein